MNQDLERLRSIKSLPQLLEYLRDKLDWEFETLDVEDLIYEYSAAEFGLNTSTAAKIREIKQLRPLLDKQPWGIFYLDFAGQRISVSSLRGILRGLVAKKRASANQSEMQKWQVENLLFICTSDDFSSFNFGYFRGSQTNRAILSTFGWHHGDTHLRTLAEYNLPALRFPSNTGDSEEWLKKWRTAFDVEKVTDEFFRHYNNVFTSVGKEVKETIKDEKKARLYTQKLFNRLMFIYFIQKKGWLSFKDQPKEKYLRALFNEAIARKENFFNDRLYWLFFRGMSVADMKLGKQTEDELRARRGAVPPLNGGLFELEDELDMRGSVPISNESFALILDLFERYNFTIEESTPLDVQVAVDPEMLGKVFEELVTGRHETGSYYTPRPIVSFMCREALKHYLQDFQPDKEAVSKFIDDEDASELQNPEAVLEALKRVRVCDPACGSGAYLLGMLHELMRLRAALFKSNKIDEATLYERKRWIIENNLYGVDNDAFAVQIACLRLWLSLAIDSDEPRPLPNLDYKIEVGDSLIAPGPSEAEKQMTFARTALVSDFRQAKGEYMREDDPDRKRKLRQRIENLRAEIALALEHLLPRLSEGQIQKKRQELSLVKKNIELARNQTIKAELTKEAEKLRRTLAAQEVATENIDTGFDWAVEFAEVFMPEAKEKWRIDDLHPMLNDFKRQGTLVEEEHPDPQSGGFDIVVANPPYVRQEILGRDYKEGKLKPIFPEVYSGTADLYVYFYGRAMQLLGKGGVGVFISSNKWLRAGYGERLRQQLLDKQAFHLIVDFGDLPVFKATAYPCIFLWQQQERQNTPTNWGLVKDLAACYEDGLREHVDKIAHQLPASQFGAGKSRIAMSARASARTKMEAGGVTLGDIAEGRFFRGIVTGLNEAFYVNGDTRKALIARDPHTDFLIKSALRGEDVRRYELHARDLYLIRVPYGFSLSLLGYDPENLSRARRAELVTTSEAKAWKAFRGKFTQIADHLKRFEDEARKRDDQGDFWWELRPCDYYHLFEKSKITFPQTAKHTRFALDEDGRDLDQTAYMIASDDLFLLGLLNSSPVESYFRDISSTVRGGYMRFLTQYLETVPIPDVTTAERKNVANLSRQAQRLHIKRRRRVEKFLSAVGIELAVSSSRNPLEQPWTLTVDDFARRARHASMKLFTDARDDTHSLTEEITKVEREIDECVAALYGVPLDPTRTTAIPSVDSDPSPFA